MDGNININKNGIWNCSPLVQPNQNLSIKKEDVLINDNLIQNSMINITSSAYGFSPRSANVESGKTYTLSMNGHISSEANSEGTTLKLYIYKPDWSYCPLILSTGSLIDTTVSNKFTSNFTGTLNLSAYSFKSQSTHGSNVTLNWIKLEEGSTVTPWIPNPTDEIYTNFSMNTMEKTISNAVYANEFIEM